jgi:hypothetical protein
MKNNKTYVSSAVLGAQFGFGFMPINRDVFRKSKSEKKGIKRMKKKVTNSGKPKTVVVFTCNETNYGTFGGKQINSRTNE